jgi:hypothetical protein
MAITRLTTKIGAAALVAALAGAARAQSSEAQPASAVGAQTEPVAVPATAVKAAPPPPAAAPVEPPEAQKVPWTRRLFSWASVGTTFAYGTTYGSANVGAGLLMQHGIAPNVELGYAFGSDPSLWTVRPGVTWYMPLPTFRPYVGTYYTHWFVGGNLQDQNGIGGRAGISLGRVISLGVTYDHAFDCNQNCDIWSPQISAGLSL